jgi:hypothetical protein
MVRAGIAGLSGFGRVCGREVTHETSRSGAQSGSTITEIATVVAGAEAVKMAKDPGSVIGRRAA